MKRLFLEQPLNEARLLHDAGAAYPGLEYCALSSEALARITAEHGVDFATALFYDRIRRSPEYGPFIAELEVIEPDLDALPRLGGTLLVAPGAFYREHPETGADGWLIREIAAEFGLETLIAPVASGGSVTENAAVLRRALAAEPEASVLLVSLSKGGADARVALDERCLPPARLAVQASGAATGELEAARRAVRVWVQICGLVRGSPVVDAVLHSPWTRAALRAHLAYRRWNLGLLEDLRHGPGALLAAPAAAPPGVLVVNILAFPLTPHLSRDARPRHRLLAPDGPNDGSSLLRDQILEPGLVYPLWGADHYFRVPALSSLLYRLFAYLARAAPAG